MATTAPPEDRTVIVPRETPTRGNTPLPYLIVVDGPRHGARFPLVAGEQVIGRAPESAIYLEDQSVSRRHATVTRQDDALQVRDDKSKNGTVVNGVPCRDAVTVGHGDLLSVGIYTLRVILRAVPAEEEMAPVAFGRGMTTEQSGEAGGETATIQDVDPAAAEPTEEPDGENAVGESAAPAKSRSPWFRRLLTGALFLGGMAGATAGGFWVYQRYFAVPPGPPPKLITRVIPPEPQPAADTTASELPVLPAEIPVFLDFLANPMPAKVLFLGKDYGLTPVQANLLLKADEQFTAEGYFQVPEFKEELVERVTFTVARDQGLIPVYFRAPIGIFKLEKLPRDVEVQIEGFFASAPNTPHTTTLSHVTYGKPMYFPYGRYIVEVRRAKGIGIEGKFIKDIRYRREILLSADSPTYGVTISDDDLEHYPVDIFSTPDGADLFLDTQPIGTTPYSGMMPMGEHLLVLQKEGYLEEAKQIKNDINQPMRFDLTLKTTEAGEMLVQGRQLILQGHFAKAVDALSQVFNKSPKPIETAQAQYWLGTAFLGQNDLERARSYFQQAQTHPEYLLRAKLGLARVALQEQKAREALLAVVDVLLKATDGPVYEEAMAVLREISPLKSVMYIRTEPAGARVLINGEQMKTETPLLIPDLGPGNYRVRVEHADYQSQELNINLSVHEFNPVLIKMLPAK